MASAVSYLKGVRTRFRNSLSVEMQIGRDILSVPFPSVDPQEYVMKSSRCIEKLKLYVDKLEIQSAKLASSLEEEQASLVENIVQEDCELCSDATDCFLELEQYKERLVEVIKGKSAENYEKVSHFEIVQLQKEMKDIVVTQLNQQREILENQNKKEKDESHVKLPKIDIISFNGDKTKWNEFWNSFETTIEKNKRLSQIEKFNYLKGKLNGDAKHAISGLSLSNENYQVALGILKDRFGNTQDVVDLHYNELINLQPATNKTHSLRIFLDKVNRHLRSLEVLNQNVNQDVFVSMLKSKLPEPVLLQLEIQKGATEKWTVYKLCDKLRDYVVAREKSDKRDSEKEHSNPPRNFNGSFHSNGSKQNKFGKHHGQFNNRNFTGNNRNSAEALVASAEQNVSYFDKCRYCQDQHWSDECKKFQSIEDRKRQLKGSCFKCLRHGHKSGDCRKGKICVHCGEKNSHHRSLCPKKFKLQNSSVHLSQEDSDNSVANERIMSYGNEVSQEVENLPENVLISSSEIVLMQTAKTEIFNPKNKSRTMTRILFDCGSQRTYISQKLATKLNLKGDKEAEIKLVTFGSEKPKIVKTKSTNLSIKLNNGKHFNLVANIVPVISGSVHRKSLDASAMEHLKHFVKEVELADDLPIHTESSSIELLIGNDYYLDLILSNKVEIQPGLYLLASKLGWIVTGRTHEMDDTRTETGFLIMSNTNSVDYLQDNEQPDSSLVTQAGICDLWNLESIGITDHVMTSDDEKAMENFTKTVQFRNGRYSVKWPWKESIPELPENRELALSRLKSCVARMRKKPDMIKRYDTIIKEQQEKGIVEKIDDIGTTGRKHYIPHHAVITPQKSTTKIRIVYDASAKVTKEMPSLNECLYRGPVLLNNLCGIFIRFRLNKIALVSDIEKAFLQVGLQEDDRDVTRFVWLKDCDKPYIDKNNVQEYRFCRVPFGVISSPFLLAATIEHHLKCYETPLAEVVKRNIYVDNLISGCETVEEGMEFYSKTKQIFSEASMNLREWISNNNTINSLLPSKDKTDVSQVNVLGHLWKVNDDEIALKTSKVSSSCVKLSKRKTLKELAEIFDPTGLFSPIVIIGKIFLQELWKKKVRWDDELSIEDFQKWMEISCELKQVSDVSIPRSVFLDTNSDEKSFKLLCFCDASTKAYSVAIYLHQTCGDSMRCDLIFSKSRLAPIKEISIPRLELMAVVIGVRSMEFVKNEVSVPIDDLYLWTDSQCVLHWISTKKELNVFVKNRINEIKQHTDIRFAYVPTKENPADVATRGTSVIKLKEYVLWWHGPEWLMNDVIHWRANSEKVDESVEKMCDAEIKCEKVNSSALLCNEEEDNKPPFGIEIGNYSSYTRLIRVTAWVQRFISRIKGKRESGQNLSCTELNSAELAWIKYIQRKHFNDVNKAIIVSKKNNLQRQLGVFISQDGILCCRGRLENADISESARHPILLPRGEVLTRLIIEKVHKEQLHGGVSQTLSKIRYRFWIPQGRSTVRQVLRHCLVCRRHEGGPFKMPDMPPFPTSRVSKSTPFSNTGLDYLGPLYIKSNGDYKKRWICLFTCLVTRAIHLEVVNDMTTEEFLYAFRRFISIRGSPNCVISDNASQFKLGSETLKSVFNHVISSENVQCFVSTNGIHWKFITELAPWMGGFYERLVGVVKRSLRKSLNRRLISDVQLITLVKEIESVVNARPLVYVGDDINSNITLTPGHFLTLNPNTGIPDIDCDLQDEEYYPVESSKEKLLKIWKKGQKLLDSFWKTWKNEYLLSLRERMQVQLKHRRIQSSYSPKVGNVILIKDDLPRSTWKLGKIVKLIPSSDGEIRSAKIQLSNGQLLGRPLNLLYPLEVDNQSEENEFIKPDKEKFRRENPVRESAKNARRKIQNVFKQ